MSSKTSSSSDQKNSNDSKTVREWLDTAAKFLAAGAGIAAIYVANSFQASLSTTNLVNQREEAESNLRATMFGNLIRPLISSDVKEGPPVDQELLLAELLALNFHENFEFKPLLIHLNDRLKTDPKIRDRQTKQKELLTIAHRVIQRQESLVTRLDQNRTRSLKNSSNSCTTNIIILPSGQTERPKNPDDYGALENALCSETVIVRAGIRESRTIVSPDQQTKVEIEIGNINTRENRLDVHWTIASTSPAQPASGKAADFSEFSSPRNSNEDTRPRIYNRVDGFQFKKNRTAAETALLETIKTKPEALDRNFSVSWFDFPMTDYTLLRDGTRLALYLDEFKTNERTKIEFVRLKLLWFPRDFFSPRERPTSYDAYRRKPWEPK